MRWRSATASNCGRAFWRTSKPARFSPRYSATFENDYREDPPPLRSILPRESFLTTSSLIATRGCHNRCGFCYLATEGLRSPYRMREPAQIAAEFAAGGEPYGVFVDNNLGSNREYLRTLCRALRPLEKIWSAAVTIDVTDDPALVREMALAGCTGVFVGFESLADQNLAEARKKTPRAGDYARRVAILHDHGIQVNGSFVLGFDHDRRDVFANTAEWVEQNRLECATYHILTPYPGTPLFRQMESEGRLLHRNWDSVRHGARRLQPAAHDRRGTGSGVRVDLPPHVFECIHLAAAPVRLERRASVPGDGVFVQTVQQALALPDRARPGAQGMEAAGGVDPASARSLPPAAGIAPLRRRGSGRGGRTGSVRAAGYFRAINPRR